MILYHFLHVTNISLLEESLFTMLMIHGEARSGAVQDCCSTELSSSDFLGVYIPWKFRYFISRWGVCDCIPRNHATILNYAFNQWKVKVQIWNSSQKMENCNVLNKFCHSNECMAFDQVKCLLVVVKLNTTTDHDWYYQSKYSVDIIVYHLVFTAPPGVHSARDYCLLLVFGQKGFRLINLQTDNKQPR